MDAPSANERQSKAFDQTQQTSGNDINNHPEALALLPNGTLFGSETLMLGSSVHSSWPTFSGFDRHFLTERTGNQNKRHLGADSSLQLQCREPIERRDGVVYEDEVKATILQRGLEIGARLPRTISALSQ